MKDQKKLLKLHSKFLAAKATREKAAAEEAKILEDIDLLLEKNGLLTSKIEHGDEFTRFSRQTNYKVAKAHVDELRKILPEDTFKALFYAYTQHKFKATPYQGMTGKYRKAVEKRLIIAPGKLKAEVKPL